MYEGGDLFNTTKPISLVKNYTEITAFLGGYVKSSNSLETN